MGNLSACVFYVQTNRCTCNEGANDSKYVIPCMELDEKDNGKECHCSAPVTARHTVAQYTSQSANLRHAFSNPIELAPKLHRRTSVVPWEL